jgi:hypothetical protein
MILPENPYSNTSCYKFFEDWQHGFRRITPIAPNNRTASDPRMRNPGDVGVKSLLHLWTVHVSFCVHHHTLVISSEFPRLNPNKQKLATH